MNKEIYHLRGESTNYVKCSLKYENFLCKYKVVRSLMDVLSLIFYKQWREKWVNENVLSIRFERRWRFVKGRINERVSKVFAIEWSILICEWYYEINW